MSEDDDAVIRRGSDNIFADLGFPDPETHLLKAQLVSRVADIVHERKLTQTQAARLMGITQPDVSRILKGRFRDVSVERILRMLTRLGCAVDILVTPQGKKTQPIHFDAAPFADRI